MASGNATLATLDNILKTHFEKKLNIMMYAEDPFLGFIKKKQNFTGRKTRQSLRYGLQQGGSLTFGNANANRSSSNDAAFELARAKDFYTGGIDAEAIVDDDEGAIVDTLKAEMEGCTRMMRRSLEIGLYGNGGGARGQLDGSVAVSSAGPYKLTDIAQIVNFEPDMRIMTASTDGTTGAIRGGTAATILSVDTDAGTITFTAALDSTVTSPGVSDFLFRDGDFGVHIKGLRSWLPASAPTPGDNFGGQDRSKFPTRLAGVRWNGNGRPYEQTLVQLLARMKREGAEKPDMLLMNTDQWANLALSVGSRGTIDLAKTSDGVFGFESIKIIGPAGAVKIVASNNVRTGEFFLLTTDTWTFRSKGQAPTLVRDDGLSVVRDPNGDGVLWRMRYYGQLFCDAPGWNAYGQW